MLVPRMRMIWTGWKCSSLIIRLMRKFMLLSLALVSTVLNAQTSFRSGLFTYKVTSPRTVEVSVADDKDASGTPVHDYVIPATVSHEGATYRVTSLGEDLFYHKDPRTVSIPESVDSIKTGAFLCADNLTSITLPSGLKYIGGASFSSSGLKSIVIPSSVVEIGENAFFSCKSLSSVQLGKGLKKIGSAAFFGCALSSVELPEGIDSIPEALFHCCASLRSVKMGSGVAYIGDLAFRECPSLTSIDLPSGVTYIGNDAFLGCTSLTSLQLPASLETLGTCFAACSGITKLTVEKGNRRFVTDGGAVYDAGRRVLYAVPSKGLQSITVPSGCLRICRGAFWGSDIKSVTLPEGIQKIDDKAFLGSALENINLPASIIYIGERAFAHTRLTEVTLPEQIERLSDAAFAECAGLVSVTMSQGLKYICHRAFLGCPALKMMNCPSATPPEFESVESDQLKPFTLVAGATLRVPKNCSASYRDAGYAEFFNITEM